MKWTNSTSDFRKSVLMITLAVAVILQTWIVLDDFVLPLRKRIRTVAELSVLERSAYLSFGDEFAKFLSFLREHVPEDAVIVVPSMDEDEVYGNAALMHYFLYPRSVTQCNSGEVFENCVRRHGRDEQYILSTLEYHAGEMLSFDDKLWIPFKGELGVYAP
jgi:hypothetical protein